MFWVSFFFTCVKREFLESRDRKKQRELQKHITYDLSQVESQTIDCDEVDGKSLPKIKSHCDRSTLKRFIIIWADIEVILMAAVLFFKHPEYDYAANFLKEICQHSWVCRGLIHKIICWKIVTSVLLRFGTKYVSSPPVKNTIKIENPRIVASICFPVLFCFVFYSFSLGMYVTGVTLVRAECIRDFPTLCGRSIILHQLYVLLYHITTNFFSFL